MPSLLRYYYSRITVISDLNDLQAEQVKLDNYLKR